MYSKLRKAMSVMLAQQFMWGKCSGRSRVQRNPPFSGVLSPLRRSHSRSLHGVITARVAKCVVEGGPPLCQFFSCEALATAQYRVDMWKSCHCRGLCFDWRVQLCACLCFVENWASCYLWLASEANTMTTRHVESQLLDTTVASNSLASQTG